MKQKPLLDSIEVAAPCSQDWNSMIGSDEARFCQHCAKDVHNLSAMTRKRARKIVAAANGSLCVRYRREPDGRIATLKKHFVQLTRQTGVAASALGATLALSAAVHAQQQESAETMGDVIISTPQFVKTSSDAPQNSISGTITDPNGAVVPFALITLVSAANNFYQTASTDGEGFYEFKNLSAADYTLKIDAAGFDSKELAQISINGDVSQNAQLAVTTVQEVVQVGLTNSNVERFVTVGMVAMDYQRPIKLIEAVESNEIDAVVKRVLRGDRINAKDKNYNGNTSLHVAAENGSAEIARYLLSAGAKIHSKNAEKRTPLMMIDEDATPELVNVLFSYGAKINAADRAGNTAFILAAESATPEIIQFLISAGANLNAANLAGRTALLNAAEANHVEVVKLLLNAGANPNAKDKTGADALTLADDDEIKQLLTTYGAVTQK